MRKSLVKKGSLTRQSASTVPASGSSAAALPGAGGNCSSTATAPAATTAATAARPLHRQPPPAPRASPSRPSRQPAAAQRWFARRLPRLEQRISCTKAEPRWRTARSGRRREDGERMAAPSSSATGSASWARPCRSTASTRARCSPPLHRHLTVAAAAAGRRRGRRSSPSSPAPARGRPSSRGGGRRRLLVGGAAARRRRPPAAVDGRAGAAARGSGGGRRRPSPQRGRQGGLPGEGGPQARVRAAGAPARGAPVHVRLRDRAAARHVRAAAAGCILAHTMGLGKSLQALALVHTLLRGGPRGAPFTRKAAIVCPASLVGNWKNEVTKWLGSTKLRRSCCRRRRRPPTPCATLCCPPMESSSSVRGLQDARRRVGEGEPQAAGRRGAPLKSGRKTNRRSWRSATKRVVLSARPCRTSSKSCGTWPTLRARASSATSRRSARFGGAGGGGRQPGADEDVQRVGEARAAELFRKAAAFMQVKDASVLTAALPPRTELVVCWRSRRAARAVQGRVARLQA